MDKTIFPASEHAFLQKKHSLRPGNARFQKWHAWEWHSHAFPPTLTPESRSPIVFANEVTLGTAGATFFYKPDALCVTKIALSKHYRKSINKLHVANFTHAILYYSHLNEMAVTGVFTCWPSGEEFVEGQGRLAGEQRQSGWVQFVAGTEADHCKTAACRCLSEGRWTSETARTKYDAHRYDIKINTESHFISSQLWKIILKYFQPLQMAVNLLATWNKPLRSYYFQNILSVCHWWR